MAELMSELMSVEMDSAFCGSDFSVASPRWFVLTLHPFVPSRTGRVGIVWFGGFVPRCSARLHPGLNDPRVAYWEPG